jgi:hypothetical protein
MCPSHYNGYNLVCVLIEAEGAQAYAISEQCADCEPRSYAVHDPMHIFFKLKRPVDNPIKYEFPLLPILYANLSLHILLSCR